MISLNSTSRITFPLLIVLSSLITYINILPNQLFFDDEELIYKNIYVQNLKFFPNYFSENMIAGAGKISNMYRPLLLTSFAIDWSIWKNNPVGFHLTSILLHTLNSLLVFILIKNLTSKKIGFITAILFAIHPIISEAVIYASGRTDPLYTFFALLSLLFWEKYIKLGKIQNYLLTIVFYIFAFLSKETAVIIPFLAILILYLNSKSILQKNFFYMLSFLFPLFAITIIYVSLRLTTLNFVNSLNFYINPTIYSESTFVRFYTFTKVFFDYIILLIFPRDLIIARSPQVLTTFLNFWTFIFLVFFIVFIIYCLKSKNKTIIFGLLWFIISLVPVSGIIPINNIMADHYLYLPSIGYFMLIAYLYISFFEKVRNYSYKKVLIFFLGVYCLLLSTRTIQRTFDFRNSIHFYLVSLTQTPGHIPMLNNLAMAYDENGEKDKAKEIYLRIINSKDIYPNVHHNLGTLYESQNDFKNARQEYLKALHINPSFKFSKVALDNLDKRNL